MLEKRCYALFLCVAGLCTEYSSIKERDVNVCHVKIFVCVWEDFFFTIPRQEARVS